MRLVGVAVHEAAGARAIASTIFAPDQHAADRLVPAAQTLRHHLQVRRDPLLLPRMHGAGAAHTAHHLVEDQQRAMPVADRAHALEIAGQSGDAAGGRADHGFRQHGSDRLGAEPLELGFQFVGQPIDILRVRFVIALETIGEARRHQAERRRQDRFVQRAPHHVAAGRQRAERVAVIALPAGDEMHALRLADLDEILPRQLQRRLGAFRAGRAEIGVRSARRARRRARCPQGPRPAGC